MRGMKEKEGTEVKEVSPPAWLLSEESRDTDPSEII
jgi:hypothetical protein